MSNFSFLQKEFFSVFDSATKAERYLNSDARAACWYTRMTLEQIVDWLYRYDNHFRSYENSLGARIHDPSFRSNAGEAIFTKATVIITIGNRAAHAKGTRKSDAVIAVTELFHIAYWLARTYGAKSRPDPSLQFNEALIPAEEKKEAISVEQLQKVDDELKQKQSENQTLKNELDSLRAELEKVKLANQKVQDDHNYNEDETRDYFIDLLLNEAGWKLNNKEDREYEVSGMPNNQGIGFVDYVLWGDDGKPLAVVEAKRTRRDPRVGQQQAKLYADCLETQFKRRPVIYYTNGYEHWFWNDKAFAPRKVQGFHSKDELELLIQRHSSLISLASEEIDKEISGRDYQQLAIRSVAEAIEKNNQRRTLIVMATGAGKTRTVIALVDLLIRCNWVKRALFLADRVSLVKQASNAFTKFLPSVGVVNLLSNPDSQGRVYLSTYPTMLNLINDNSADTKRFGIGHFDLVVVDEAHRSIYSKYGAIFSYFDSYLVGLTATPKDEVDHNTYNLFEMEKGVPTYAYPLDDAIADKWLVPPKAVSVPMQFQRKGIKYEDLSEEEKQQWDELDWGEAGPPEEVDPAALNQWLFNQDTVDLVLKHLMEKGERVASGDRLGKTIIFAKNNNHAEYIAERFNINYPEYKGEFARVITFKTEYAQDLIDKFSIKESAPHIAISVDMLDTGIDVPEIVNLVFFKLVRSKTKFWQMIGRGTRTCEDLYSPGEDKKFFYIFDFCQNLEYFSQNPDASEGSNTDSLDTRLFKMRVDLINNIDTKDQSKESKDLRDETAKHLHELVANMTLENFIVRPKRKMVEKYSNALSWKSFTTTEAAEIQNDLASLPSQLRDNEEEAKRFDYMVIKAQLCLLQTDKEFERYQNAIRAIAFTLELQDSIPAIKAKMPLIQEVSSEEWWQDVTVAMLEHVRRQLRLLVKLLEKTKREIVYTNFEDAIGEGSEVNLPITSSGINYEKFKAKSSEFLKTHQDRISIQKLRRNKPITSSDLDEIEKILLDLAEGNQVLINKAKEETAGLGLFVRKLVGLEKASATEAMQEFLNDTNASANQLTFIRMLIDYLTIDGSISADRLYESPFIGISATGPDAIFPKATVDKLVFRIDEIRRHAVA